MILTAAQLRVAVAVCSGLNSSSIVQLNDVQGATDKISVKRAPGTQWIINSRGTIESTQEPRKDSNDKESTCSL